MLLMFCAFTVVAQDNNANPSSDNLQDQAHKSAAQQDQNAADQ